MEDANDWYKVRKIFIYFWPPLQILVVLTKKSNVEHITTYLNNSLKLLAKVETLLLATNNAHGETKLCNTFFFNEFFISIKVQWSIIIIKYFYFNIIRGQNFQKIIISFIAKVDFEKSKYFFTNGLSNRIGGF
jgi:hypothetical protein